MLGIRRVLCVSLARSSRLCGRVIASTSMASTSLPTRCVVAAPARLLHRSATVLSDPPAEPAAAAAADATEVVDGPGASQMMFLLLLRRGVSLLWRVGRRVGARVVCCRAVRL
jgi:hypothetical protein